MKYLFQKGTASLVHEGIWWLTFLEFKIYFYYLSHSHSYRDKTLIENQIWLLCIWPTTFKNRVCKVENRNSGFIQVSRHFDTFLSVTRFLFAVLLGFWFFFLCFILDSDIVLFFFGWSGRIKKDPELNAFYTDSL